MGDSSETHRKLDDSPAVNLTGRIMVVGIVVLFFVVVFVLFLHLYAKWFWNRQHPEPPTPTATTTNHHRRRRRRRFDFAPGYQELAANHRRGLDPSSLKALPITTFDPKDFHDGLECAVCLSDVVAGEKVRLLPECNHGFHLECIDMWFQSHSTCPLCRNPVGNQPQIPSEATVDALNQPRTRTENQQATESLSFPTNVLFWGDQVQVSTMGSSAMEEELHVPSTSFPPSPSSSSSSSPSLSPSSTFGGGGDRPDGFLVIDIPRQISEEEELKSPVIPTRLRSLKRLLTRDRRVNPSSSSSGVNVEQQGRSQN